MIGEKTAWSFKKQLSFDGVAIFGCFVTFCVWFGSLSETVKQHSESIKQIQTILQQQSELIKINTVSVSVLTSIVNERIPKPR